MNELSVSSIQSKIYAVRGVHVMLDSDLAQMYGIQTGMFNRAVSRNLERFPSDFMFRLTKEEFDNLMFQIGISSSIHGGRRKLPYVFTEQGVYMLSGVVKSEFAIRTNIAIIRTFTALRRAARELSGAEQEIRQLKNMVNLHIESVDGKVKKQDSKILELAKVLDFLIAQPPKTKRKIGFGQ